MDWKKTLTQGQIVIHAFFIIMILAATATTLYSFRMVHLQKDEEQQILKLNQLVNNLKQDKSFEKIGKYLSWAQADKAHEVMRSLHQTIAQTEDLLEIKADASLGKEIGQFDELININTGLSNPDDVLKQLNQKVKNLSTIASTKKFKTIEFVSQRMMERLKSLNAKNVGGSIQVGYMKTDLDQLKTIVEKSSIDDPAKKEISEKLISMSHEIDLLINLNNQSRNLKKNTNRASQSLSNWVRDVEKKALVFKNIKNQKQNNLILMLSGIVAFLVLAWMGLAYLFRWQKNSLAKQMETEVQTVISNGLMSDQRFVFDQYSDSTRTEILKILDGLKVKLNLGTLLHEGLPFAGCMIDPSFKMTWYNQLFLDQLFLSEDEIRSDAFNWDYVRDYLNLDQDPIYQALVNKISGIYPVKIKQDELAPALPYEMYVTPVMANREERVMVFFYPLVAVKDAIQEQVTSSQNTIYRFIELWNAERLDEDELALLEKDFKNQDLQNLYQELFQVFNRVTDEKLETLHTINNLEKENQALKEKIKIFEDVDHERKVILRNEVRLTSELRETILQTMEKNETLLYINKTILQQSDDYKNEAHKLQLSSFESQKRVKESLDIIQQMDQMKSDYKKIKFELMEIKVKLISLNNSFYGQLPPLDENQQKLATRYKDELARLDFTVAALDKKLMQLDVLISKILMINEKIPVEQATFSFQTTQKDHELREIICDIQKKMTEDEEKIQENFHQLLSLMKKESKAENKIEGIRQDRFLS